MSATLPRGPNGSAKPHDGPALATRLKCPNCGREPAIVFPLIEGYDKPVKDAPLVCLDCCLGKRNRV